MPTWPGTLPTNFVENSYRESPPDNRVVQPMEVGPPQIRRSSTAGIRPVQGRMSMTTAQVATFDTFYNDTLYSGSLSFDGLNNGRTGAAVDHIFTDVPRYTPNGPDHWLVDMKLGQLP